MTKLTARGAALKLLAEVLRERAAFDDAFERLAATLSPQDRAFARNLVATTLRHLGEIDAVIGARLEKPLPDAAYWVIDALRLGAAQILYLKTPAHAAVSETVALIGAPRYRGLVNAILRRIARDGEAALATLDPPRLDTPAWMWERWTAAYGEATARAIAAAHLVEPPLDLALKEGEDAAHWAERLGARILPAGTLRLASSGRIALLAGYEAGAWWVQDAAARLPALILAPKPGDAVLDLCAAPGGKTAQLLSLGAAVTAVERSEKRLRRLAANLARLHLTATLIAADAASFRPDTPASHVLLDAPCSATGTIRRHPELPYQRTPEDIARLTTIQDRLLAAAAAMLAPGGVLVYAVCSLEKEEGEERIAALLASEPLLRRRPVEPRELPGLEAAITPEGDVRTLPCHWPEEGGLDGFYIARLERTA